MNPEKVYPLIVKVSNFEIHKHKTIENVVTGERKTHEVREKHFMLDHGKVKVQPVFAGCLVSPPYKYTNFDNEEDTLEFSITPIIRDKIEGYIDLLQDEQVFHTMPLYAKIMDPRMAKLTASYGVLGSFIPKILNFIGFNVAQNTKMEEIIPELPTILGSLSLSNFIAVFGSLVMIVIGFIYYLTLLPSKERKSLKFSSLQKSLQKELEREEKIKAFAQDMEETRKKEKKKSKAKPSRKSIASEKEKRMEMATDLDNTISEWAESKVSTPAEEEMDDEFEQYGADESEMITEQTMSTAKKESEELSNKDFVLSKPPPSPPTGGIFASSSPSPPKNSSGSPSPPPSGGKPPAPGAPSAQPSLRGSSMDELKGLFAKQTSENTYVEMSEDIPSPTPFSEQLDAHFDDWEQKEITKEGKVK